jgi:hypothetical protein
MLHCSLLYTLNETQVSTSVTPVENSTGSLIICYIRFRTINFLGFLQYSIRILHVIGRHVEADV